MPPYLLASASTTVKIWDFPSTSGKSLSNSAGSTANNVPSDLNQQLVTSFVPIGAVGVSSIRWGHDSMQIQPSSLAARLNTHTSHRAHKTPIHPSKSTLSYLFKYILCLFCFQIKRLL